MKKFLLLLLSLAAAATCSAQLSFSDDEIRAMKEKLKSEVEAELKAEMMAEGRQKLGSDSAYKAELKAEIIEEMKKESAAADSAERERVKAELRAEMKAEQDSARKSKKTVWMSDASEMDDSYMDNDVVPILDKSGFGIRTKAGDFLFKPYALIHTAASFKYYDDEGLNLAEQDRVLNSGFSIPNAIIGISGKAFNRVTFNIAINASKTGANILQQAWFDVFFFESLRLKAGKFKTPFMHGYLSTLGQTLFPELPSSMTTAVRTNLSLDAVQPSINTGFDLGVTLHGSVKERFEYEVGVFNGTGSSVNTATRGTSDDYKGLPSLLYAARIAYTPFGSMPGHQGDPGDLNSNKLSVALSANYLVEANSESSNDVRAGVEVSWIYKRLYVAAEFYMLKMYWTSRMQNPGLNPMFWGAYVQAGYFITPNWQLAARYDFMDRNGIDVAGFLNMPAVGVNYYFSNINLKLQAMYQFLGRWGHATQLERDGDDLGMAMHSATIQLQYTF